MNFTNVNKNHDPLKTNFWDLNPQLQYIIPYSKLKKELTDSSHYMWAIFFMCDPDEEINKLYRYDLDKRKEHINNMFTIDWDNETFKECIDSYPFDCMDSTKRALKEQIDSLKRRSKLFKQKYTLDYSDENGRRIIGTAKQLDDMHVKTSKIYDQLEEVLAKFTKQKDDDMRVYGGRQESASEKGLM